MSSIGIVYQHKEKESSPEQKPAENEVGLGQEKEGESQRQNGQTVANFDQEDGFIGQPPLMYHQLSLTDAMDENNRRYFATAHAQSIQEFARIIADMGDQLETEYELKWKSELEEPKRGLFQISIEKLRSVRNTVDTVFEYLEYMGHRMLEDVKTYEGVLRGILNFSELAFQLEIFTFLKFVVKCIDVPEDPYPAQRKFIKKSLEDIEQQEAHITTLVEEAGEVLTSIVRDKALDISKAQEFDNVMRKAKLAVNNCKRSLESVDPVIEELLQKTYTIKWFSRGIRVCCMGITWSYLYNKYSESDVSLPVALGGGVMTGFMWLSLFPSRSYKLYDSLRDLQGMNKRLNDKLEELHVRMESDQSHKEKFLQGSDNVFKPRSFMNGIATNC